ncbi:nickel ABC transporter ATP-binding protein NikE [Microbacterium sp. ASV49]|uniref:ABC transporter ATP-binding protein n=1 Tax=Microbacterium candidum TaxID=3041922 RepID=A0ABT7N117_9MICO|nr:ABC transporter ATP-binding protein [Microbacterium sp. ASV49]MDL9980392.1 ABC transporter ATP-binding protein [Microbacterium sp. ASV49]
MSGSANALELRDLNVWFDPRDGRGDPVQVVEHLDLAVAPGERVGLVGESGSGKTTTILAAMGLLPASATVSGGVLIDGVDAMRQGETSMHTHRWTDIAMVFQGAMSAFNPVKTVGWQVREAMEIHGIAKGRAAERRTDELLSLVGLPAGTQQKYPHQLSGGMKQRAVIAMALSCDPKVLLADEPTTALDVVVQDQILRLLARLSDELGLALVLVTHDLGVVAQACTRAAVMRDGRIVEDGPIEQLYRDPSHPYTRQLFDATPDLFAVTPREEPAPAAPLLDVSALRVVYGQGGRKRGRGASTPAGAIDLSLSPSPMAATETIMTTNVRDDAADERDRANGAAVDGIDLQVSEGEFVALVGQSGCGKTTTLQAILGMVPVASGSIRIDGTEVAGLRAREWRPLRRDVQMIYQDPYEALDGRFRVRDAVMEPLIVHREGSRTERRERVAEALSDVGLDPDVFGARFPHELSGGQRQRVAIAASLVLRPHLLLADEPVSMLDVSVRTGVLQLLDRLRHSHRMGILMITHDLSTAAAYADRIVVMRAGRIVEQGDPWSIVHEPTAEYTERLLASVPSPDPARAVR